ncbi:MAG: phosphate ABC transporter permease subunit PstC [bacterium]
MTTSSILGALILLLAFGYIIGRKRSLAASKKPGKQARGKRALHSLPSYYGYMVALWAGLPALLILLLWTGSNQAILTTLTTAHLPQEIQSGSSEQIGLFINEVKNLAASGNTGGIEDPVKRAAVQEYQRLQQISTMAKAVVVLAVAMLGLILGLRAVKPETRARNRVERIIRYAMLACASIAVLTTVGIVFSVLFEALRFFASVPPIDFLFGLQWSPQTAIRADQVGSSGAFGAIPLFVGTLLISAIAMLIAVPLGLMSAIYLSEYATSRQRSIAKPILEILAGIPTVVYGFFAALTVAPFIRDLGESIGLDVSSESALAAGLVMGVMLVPFVSSLADDAISAVPRAMKDGSLGMGATHSETIRMVLIPAALPGIVGGILLAASRAIGETMIVVMAAGLSANLTINPLEAVTTVTVQIVTLLTGDQEFDSPKTLAAFALGLGLFLVTLFLNVIALHVIRKYREQYD